MCAVDSRDKRASATNLPWSPLYPDPSVAITVSGRMMASGLYALPVWVSASSVEGVGWDNTNNAIDSNTATFASQSDFASLTPLTLEWSGLPRTDKIRIFAHDVDIIAGTHDASSVKVEVYYDSVYNVLIASGTIPEDVWYEYPIGKDIVGDIIRITSLDQEEYLYVADVQFVNLDSFILAASSTKIDGGQASAPLLRGGLVR